MIACQRVWALKLDVPTASGTLMSNADAKPQTTAAVMLPTYSGALESHCSIDEMNKLVLGLLVIRTTPSISMLVLSQKKYTTIAQSCAASNSGVKRASSWDQVNVRELTLLGARVDAETQYFLCKETIRVDSKYTQASHQLSCGGGIVYRCCWGSRSRQSRIGSIIDIDGHQHRAGK